MVFFFGNFLYIILYMMESTICLCSLLTNVDGAQKLCKWFTQLLLAVEYLHSNFVLHRDLKVLALWLSFITKRVNPFYYSEVPLLKFCYSL